MFTENPQPCKQYLSNNNGEPNTQKRACPVRRQTSENLLSEDSKALGAEPTQNITYKNKKIDVTIIYGL